MHLRGTNQEFGRPYNRRIVLETIRLSAPISRGEIAQKVGLTVQTVSTITRELEEQGFVRGARETPKGRGHPPTTLTLNPEGGFAIGLHVNGTKTHLRTQEPFTDCSVTLHGCFVQGRVTVAIENAHIKAV